MSNLDKKIRELMNIGGSLSAAMVDSTNGMILASIGGGIDIEIAAAGNTDVLRAELKAINILGINDTIDDILISMGRQYHIIRPLRSVSDVFIYLVLDVMTANLALARRKVNEFDATIHDI